MSDAWCGICRAPVPGRDASRHLEEEHGGPPSEPDRRPNREEDR